jgi:hypothetical protein
MSEKSAWEDDSVVAALEEGDEDDTDEVLPVAADEGSEQPESSGEPEPDSDSKANERDERLTEALARVQDLNEKIDRLEAERQSDKSSDVESKIEEVKYDIGDIVPADYADLRETLNAQGTFLARENERTRLTLMKEIEGLRAEIRQGAVSKVRSDLKLDSDEEREAAAWLKGLGFSYRDPEQLAKGVEAYRVVKKAKASQDEPEKPKGAKPTLRPRQKSTSAATTRKPRPAAGNRRDTIMLESFKRTLQEARGKAGI